MAGKHHDALEGQFCAIFNCLLSFVDSNKLFESTYYSSGAITMGQKSTAHLRLTQIKDFLTMSKTATTIPWDPDCTKFPTRNELPSIPGAPLEAAWVWGENDYVCFTLCNY